MKIVTTIKKSDLIKLNLSLVFKIKSTYVSVLIIAVLAFLFILWKRGMPSNEIQWMITVGACLAGGIIGTLASLLFNMLCIIFMSSANIGVLGEHQYYISPEGLHEKTEANEGLSKWQGIADIRVSKSYLFFRISGYLYHILPKRDFPSLNEFEEFSSKSLKYWEDAHNKKM